MAGFERRYEDAEPQRINRWLAQAGVCSRREAEALIAAGKVRIDGEVVADAGRKIMPGQVLTLEGEGPGGLDARFTAVINKPVGVVSAQPDPGQTPAVRLIAGRTEWRASGARPSTLPNLDGGLAPLGRLDMDSRGLLLLSQDGVLAKAVIGPQSPLDKEYRVRVSGEITKGKIALMRHGLELDGRKLKPARVNRLGQETLEVLLTEGRNRQIRRMCELVGLQVVDLVRLRIGPLKLGDLPEGLWRPLNEAERAALIEAAGPSLGVDPLA